MERILAGIEVSELFEGEHLKTTILDHEKRITDLEKTDIVHKHMIELQEERLKNVEAGYTKVENTIIKESQRQADRYEKSMERLWGRIERMETSQQTAADNEQELKVQTLAFRKSRWERTSEIFLKLAGAGGLLYLIIESILANF